MAYFLGGHPVEINGVQADKTNGIEDAFIYTVLKAEAFTIVKMSG